MPAYVSAALGSALLFSRKLLPAREFRILHRRKSSRRFGLIYPAFLPQVQVQRARHGLAPGHHKGWPGGRCACSGVILADTLGFVFSYDRLMQLGADAARAGRSVAAHHLAGAQRDAPNIVEYRCKLLCSRPGLLEALGFVGLGL
jgi:hypothetical protein